MHIHIHTFALTNIYLYIFHSSYTPYYHPHVSVVRVARETCLENFHKWCCWQLFIYIFISHCQGLLFYIYYYFTPAVLLCTTKIILNFVSFTPSQSNRRHVFSNGAAFRASQGHGDGDVVSFRTLETVKMVENNQFPKSRSCVTWPQCKALELLSWNARALAGRG